VEFLDPRDADDAMYALDRTMVGGREIQVGMGMCIGMCLVLTGVVRVIWACVHIVSRAD